MYQTVYINHNHKPFVGFIVGPYSPKLNCSKVVSEFTCFYVVDKNDGYHPYELSVNIVPQKRISTRIVEDLKNIYDLSRSAPDRVNLGEKWKGKMKRHEKLRKCIRSLIKQNNEDLQNFDAHQFVDQSAMDEDAQLAFTHMTYTNITENEKIGDEDTIEVSESDLLAKLTSNWNIRARGRKSNSEGIPKIKTPIKSSNKIVIRIDEIEDKKSKPKSSKKRDVKSKEKKKEQKVEKPVKKEQQFMKQFKVERTNKSKFFSCGMVYSPNNP